MDDDSRSASPQFSSPENSPRHQPPKAQLETTSVLGGLLAKARGETPQERPVQGQSATGGLLSLGGVAAKAQESGPATPVEPVTPADDDIPAGPPQPAPAGTGDPPKVLGQDPPHGVMVAGRGRGAGVNNAAALAALAHLGGGRGRRASEERAASIEATHVEGGEVKSEALQVKREASNTGAPPALPPPAPFRPPTATGGSAPPSRSASVEPTPGPGPPPALAPP
eukprot:Hpha_TRINITY_DN5272_c0_g1::TRINITY_DN5272_c0_g1_i1::g.116575::m.116575